MGFIVVRGFNEYDVTHVINHFRNLELGGTAISVDEVYIHCHGLPDNISERPFQLIPRLVRAVGKVGDASKKRLKQETNHNHSPISISLTEVPSDEYNLMKTEFVCIDNLPKNIAKAGLIFDINRPSDGCVIIPQRDSR